MIKLISSINQNRVKYVLAALVLLQVADGVLTNILIKLGIASEGNPLLINIAGKNSLVVFKIVGVLVAVWILWDIHQRHPRLALWAASVFLLAYTGIVAWNSSLLLTGIN